jgi:glycogen operon protein
LSRAGTPALALDAGGLEAGRAWPLGAHWDGEGVNFAVFSAHAEAVELCLYDAHGQAELRRVRLDARTDDVWHGYLRGAAPGLVYGLRAHGPWAPVQGHRYNPHKLLLDPYARELVGAFEWRPEHFGSARDDVRVMDARDNGASALKARVVADRYDWSHDGVADRPPRTPLADTVIYEAHVKGLTRLHPDVPEALRGTYAGLASPAMVGHLQRLGVTALSLLPVHAHLDEERLARLGLVNYWGYNTIGFFAVEPRYAAGMGVDGQVAGTSTAGQAARDEFRGMVKRLHAAGIEVLLDVVYNHTAEGDERGPTLSWRGLDNRSYYRTLPGDPDRYDNLSGCGNALDLRQPRVVQLVLDSLRYWVGEMHVDGFRFDLAPVLGRGEHGFDARHAFFQALAQDPLLAGAKLVAEPWDLGPGGYRLGGFPRGWLEWNDRFRDTARSFWLHGAAPGEFARRLCASSDLYEAAGRAPAASVNYVAAHDGFTLRDVVSYAHKHNEANGEHNRDGHDVNHSANCGAEGASADPAVLALRGRLQRALLATLLLSQGTPMLCAGDELGQTQGGNNNAYCQDNATTWLDWDGADRALLDYAARLVALRRRLLPLGARWLHEGPDAAGRHDIAWLRADGARLSHDDWAPGAPRVLGARIGAPGRAREPLLLLVNAEALVRPFALPPGRWRRRLDSAPGDADPQDSAGGVDVCGSYLLQAHSVVLLSAAVPAEQEGG